MSQLEYWARDYIITANSKEEALAKYTEYLNSFDETLIDIISPAEYLEDFTQKSQDDIINGLGPEPIEVTEIFG